MATSLVVTVAVSAGVGGAVSFVVSGLLKSTSDWWIERRQTGRNRKELLATGDHLVIESIDGLPLGPGGHSTRVSVAVAPAVKFSADAALDPDAVAQWVQRVDPALLTHRQYSDPEDLIRYVHEDTYVLVSSKGLIRVIAPVDDQVTTSTTDPGASLPVSSVASMMVRAVVSIVDVGGFITLFPGRLRTDRVDWHFDVSSHLMIAGVMVPRIGLRFRGREPSESTPGQVAPLGGPLGFGGRDLRNISITTEPADVVMTALTAFIEKSGYSGLADCLVDLRGEVDELVTQARFPSRSG